EMSLTLFNKQINEISERDIQSLITSGSSEHRQLEFKQELPCEQQLDHRQKGKKKDPKFEFICDISAMANGSGGDIIFGIGEDKSSNTLFACPFPIPDWDKLKLRLQGWITSGIEPIIIGYDIERIPTSQD